MLKSIIKSKLRGEDYYCCRKSTLPEVSVGVWWSGREGPILESGGTRRVTQQSWAVLLQRQRKMSGVRTDTLRSQGSSDDNTTTP